MNKERRKVIRLLKVKLAEVRGHVLRMCDEEGRR